MAARVIAACSQNKNENPRTGEETSRGARKNISREQNTADLSVLKERELAYKQSYGCL